MDIVVSRVEMSPLIVSKLLDISNSQQIRDMYGPKATRYFVLLDGPDVRSALFYFGIW
jgi:hypothetical protein